MPGETPETYSEALRRLTSKVQTNSANHRAQQWRANRNGVDPDMLDFERMFVRRLTKMNIPVFAHNMMRTPAEQDELYVKGVTKARGGESPHNYGMAGDIIHSLYAWDIPKECWDVLGHIGKEVASSAGIAVTWGGDWKFWDPAHWELSDWKERVKQRSNVR